MKKIFLSLAFCCVNLALFSQSLRIATYQYADNNRIANIQPLATHLKATYAIEATVKSYPTVHALITAIQNGETDIALINTFGYLLLETSEKKYPMEAVLALQTMENATDNYKTVIVSSSNSGIADLPSLQKLAKRSRLMLVAKGSTSGNLVPRLALSNLGLTNADQNFRSLQYAGNHRAAFESLLDGRADIAAMGHTELEKHVRQDSLGKHKINLLWTSSEIPLGPVLLHSNLDKATRELIIKSFLQLHEENANALESLKAGWSEAKQASHFIRLKTGHYNSFMAGLGKEKDLQRILREFVN